MVFWVAADAAIRPSHTRAVTAGWLKIYVKRQVNQTVKLPGCSVSEPVHGGSRSDVSR